MRVDAARIQAKTVAENPDTSQSSLPNGSRSEAYNSLGAGNMPAPLALAAGVHGGVDCVTRFCTAWVNAATL